MKRRDFFKVMGIASGAALSACKVNNADKKLLPYLVPPEDGIIPGIPRYVRSTCMECPAHCGINIKIREDKPVKLEGNPDHPVNKGGLCMRGQASLARLYHPDRLKQPMLKSADGTFKPVSWDEAAKAFHAGLKESKSKGLRNVFFSGRSTETLSGLVEEFCQALEIERLKEFEIFHHGAIKTANKGLFGLDRVPYYHIDKCDVMVTVGADLLDTFISPVEWSRLYAEGMKKNNLLWYHMEPYLTLTGAAAAKRLVNIPGSEPYLLSFLLRHVTLGNPLPESLMAGVPEYTMEQTVEFTGLAKEEIEALVKALNEAKQPLLISGGAASNTHNGLLTAQLTAMLQWGLGMVNSTVDFSRPLNDGTEVNLKDIGALARACRDGKVGFIMFSRIANMGIAPKALEFMTKPGFKVGVAGMPDNVTKICDLVLPLSNPLESWGDAEPWEGLKSLIQPVIEPLHDTKSEGDILLTLLGRLKSFRDYLADRWEGVDETWIDKGFRVMETGAITARLAEGTVLGKPGKPVIGGCTYITPSLRAFDGRSRNLAILEEIPDPLTTVSFGKWAAASLKTAKDLKLTQGEIVEFQRPMSKMKLPVLLSPALRGNLMTIGIDALTDYNLPLDGHSGEFVFLLEDVKLLKTGERIKMPVLSGGQKTGKRGILPHLEHDDNDHGHHHEYKRHTLYEPHEHKDYRWGMVIDLDACTGCSACVAACYIENNIPMVGKAEHLKGREMAWLRIEPYFNDPNQPEFVPMMCQQCDCAPCETVCPVYATYHNEEGLNAQVYNRCVGTRYCANNCPYKARRFNWFDHSQSLPLYKVSNPDLSVRPKGVMEKCTFCIQRIRYAKDRAKDEKRLVTDGEVIPACAQTCPSGAITFGNLMDPDSKVSKLAKSSGAYRVQELLGTEPAVYYIKKKK